MKPITAESSYDSSQNKISVRLPAGGDLFVIDDLLPSRLEIPLETESNISIELLTKRTMLIPTCMLEEETERAVVVERELSIAGITYYQDEEIVTISRGGITALLVVPKVVMSRIEGEYADSILTFDTPLLHEAIVERPHIFIDSHLGLTTVKVYTKSEITNSATLLFADIYDTPTDAYAIYWIQRVVSASGLGRDIPLYIYRCSKTTESLLLQNFKTIMTCE